MKTVVIFSGRFQPFHKGHKSCFNHLTEEFGDGSVFVVTSDVQSPLTSPFAYSDKVAMMTKMGIPVGKIAKVKNPYRAEEITSEIDNPEDTALVFAVSEKDMEPGSERFKFGKKKDGSQSYIQPLPENKKKLKPLTEHAYVYVTPTYTFKIQDADANSATQIREKYIQSNDADRDNILAELYGMSDIDLREIFDQKLKKTKATQKFIGESRNILSIANNGQKKKILSILESIHSMENSINHIEYEDLVEDYLNER
jgi:cytidyltransferase-like protein